MKLIEPDDITVLILAGGKGRRLGGQDKGLVEYQGRALIEHVIDIMQRQTSNILINANRNQQRYQQLGYPVIADTLDDFQGPLAGFLAAMSAAKTRYILTLPCDGPQVADDYLQTMVDGFNAELANGKPCRIAVATDGVHVQPVYALIDASLKPDLTEFLCGDERKIMRWYHRHPCVQVAFAEAMFSNINSPQDLQT